MPVRDDDRYPVHHPLRCPKFGCTHTPTEPPRSYCAHPACPGSSPRLETHSSCSALGALPGLAPRWSCTLQVWLRLEHDPAVLGLLTEAITAVRSHVRASDSLIDTAAHGLGARDTALLQRLQVDLPTWHTPTLPTGLACDCGLCAARVSKIGRPRAEAESLLRDRALAVLTCYWVASSTAGGRALVCPEGVALRDALRRVDTAYDGTHTAAARAHAHALIAQERSLRFRTFGLGQQARRRGLVDLGVL